MKKITLLPLIAVCLTASAADETVILDLTKSTTKLEFNATNGSWNETFNDDVTSLESQVFSFVKGSMGEYATWWGFTASNSANNEQPEDFVAMQWSNMAAGGIALDENGAVKLNENGSPVVDAAVPYVVGYYGTYFSKRPTDMIFAEGKSYEPQGVYINLTSYPYYCLEFGNTPARPFSNGDKFTLTIHGVAADESEKSIDVDLCTYTNGDLTINRGWKYVDLTSLGAVNELYFTMDGTDAGEFGLNTPAYFALDKLSAKPAAEEAVVAPAAARSSLSYDRTSKTLSWSGAEFADVRDTAGRTVMSGTDGELDLSALPGGVYIARAGARSLKLVR